MIIMCKRQGLRGRVEKLRGQDLMMEVLQKIGLRYKTSLDSRSGFLIKFLPSSLSLVVIGFLTICLRREKVLVYQSRSPLVESVARNTMVIALRGWTIVLVVIKVGTRLTNVRGQDEGSGQAQASGSNEATNKNRFYALHSRGK